MWANSVYRNIPPNLYCTIFLFGPQLSQPLSTVPSTDQQGLNRTTLLRIDRSVGFRSCAVSVTRPCRLVCALSELKTRVDEFKSSLALM